MGVKNLWRLLMPIGRRISLETLEGQILAVDASIWLTQFLKAMRDPTTGKALPAAHLMGFVRRLCRLYFHGIKPVFVFDGPTPAIKLREINERRRKRDQFSKLDQGAVQRLARRLLAENLKKKKKPPPATKNEEIHEKSPSTSGNVSRNGAYAAGFHMPEEAHDQVSSRADSTKDSQSKTQAGNSSSVMVISLVDDSDNENKHTPSLDNPQKALSISNGGTSVEDEAAILASIQEDLLAAEQEKAYLEETENDFDGPAMAGLKNDSDYNSDDQSEEASDDEYQPQEGSNIKRFFNTSRKKKMKNRIVDCENVEQISKLPSNERKEAIEEAKRRQRLQSRKEFMPAAAIPTEFSSVQLSNFLKSSRFNLKVQQMTSKHVASNNEKSLSPRRREENVVMASDRTTRISLIRENDGPSSTAVPSKGDPSSRANRPQSRVDASLSVDASQSDEEDEIIWEDGGSPHSKNTRQKVILDSEEEEGQNSVPTLQHGKSDETSRSISREATHASSLIILDGSSSDDDGGFLREEGSKSSSRSYSGRKRSSEVDVGEGGEGEEIVEGIGQTKSDEALARALQESEDAKAAAELCGNLDEDDEQSIRDYDSNQNYLANKGIEGTQADSAIDIDDDVKHSPMHPSKTKNNNGDSDKNRVQKEAEKIEINHPKASTLESGSVNHSSEESIAWEDGDDDASAPQARTTESRTANLNSDESILWEDGDRNITMGQGQKYTNNESLLENESSVLEKAKSGHSRFTSESKTDFSDLIQSESPHGSMLRNSFDESDHLGASLPISSSQNAETAAVLERAQGTASSLADWAGRAFRRAMREVGEGKPLSTSPSASKETNTRTSPLGEVGRDSKIHSRAVASPLIQTSTKTSSQTFPDRTGRSSNSSNARSAESSLQAVEISEDMLKKWETERQQRERDNDTVTDEMKEEAIRLLQLFGVPYIEAPAEAEAQCVALEQLGLVNGIVTEDSDAFAFGAKKVYKNIFEEQKFAEAYMASDAEKEMGLNHDAMVALAMLLGSDYTIGVKGVGIVNAMEVLEEFEVAADVKEGLSKFAFWLAGFDPRDTELKTTEASKKTEGQQSFHEKHKSARSRWVAPSNFPADNVIGAYTRPVVDKNSQPFSWGKPDVEGLVHFCAKNIGWPAEETRKLLEPVVARKAGRYSQTRLDSFVRYEHGLKFADVRSKRLRTVLERKTKSKKRKTATDVE